MAQTQTREQMIWSGPGKWPDGTPRASVDDGRPVPPEASPQVQNAIPGYTLPVHRHDRAVDIRDAEIPLYRSTRGRHLIGLAIGVTVGTTIGSIIGSSMQLGGGTVPGSFIGGGTLGLLLGAIGVLVASFLRANDEEEFWRQHHVTRGYYDPNLSFDKDYQPAYELGYETRLHYRTQPFHEVEPLIQQEWENRREESALDWSIARHVILDAWARHDEQKARLEAKPQSY